MMQKPTRYFWGRQRLTLDRTIRSPGGGDNLFLSSIVAVDASTGKMRWYYQTTPGDNWDYTAVQDMMLADMEIDGKKRKVIMQAPKNGFFYVLDRQTGELLRANPYVTVNWASHIDMETGRPVENPDKDFLTGDRSGSCLDRLAGITGSPCRIIRTLGLFIFRHWKTRSYMTSNMISRRQGASNILKAAGIPE